MLTLASPMLGADWRSPFRLRDQMCIRVQDVLPSLGVA